MSRIVMKFGGTSVGSIDKIKNVANVIIQLKTDAWKTYTDQDTPKT